MMQGIDLSKHNVVTDESKLSGKVDFMIIRAGGNFGGYYKDSKFERYYNMAKILDIPVGAYYDAGKEFYTTEKGIAYAKHFIQLMSGKQFDMPVYLDIEVTPKKYKKLITDACIAFCDTLEKAGYFAGIYASDISGFADMLEYNRLTNYTLWVARYGKKPTYVKNPPMWQYSSKGTVNGIRGNVDLDYCYVDFPKIIKRGHFNGY